MIDIDENQAKEILDFLVTRFFKHLNGKYNSYEYSIVDYDNSLAIAKTSSHNMFIMPTFLLFIQDYEFKVVQKIISIGTHPPYTNVQKLDILLHWTSIGYDIIIGYDIMTTTHMFLPAYANLEQLFVEKDLEENMIA